MLWLPIYQAGHIPMIGEWVHDVMKQAGNCVGRCQM